MNKRFLSKAIAAIGVGVLTVSTTFAATVPTGHSTVKGEQQISHFNGNSNSGNNNNGNGNSSNNNNGNGNSSNSNNGNCNSGNNNNGNGNNGNGNGNDKEESTKIIERAIIKNINPNNQRVTILPEGEEDVTSNYLALRVNNNKTNIEGGTFNDLEEGMVIYVEHSSKISSSTPGQTDAITIKISDEVQPPEQDKIVHENMTILDIDHETGIMEVGRVKEAYDKTQVEYIVLIDENTDVTHHMNEMHYTYKDLEEGMVVTVVQEAITMPSAPPTIQATDVIITQDVDNEIPELEDIVHENMTILSIDHENGMMEIGVTKEAYGAEHVEYRVYIDETTDVRHYMNEMHYTYKDLKEGMVVTVVQAPITMPSVPPTIQATDVIITQDVDNQIPELEDVVHENMTILSIDHEEGVMEIGLVKEAQKSTEAQYRVYIDETTDVRHYMNKMHYTYNDLEEGMVVTVVQDPITMPSLPPTISAKEVIITGEPSVEVPELENITHENMTILSIDHEEGIMEIGSLKQPLGQQKVAYRVYIGEGTTVRHERNKMHYTYKNLEEGMAITVVQNPITMPSAIPVFSALEVIIVD